MSPKKQTAAPMSFEQASARLDAIVSAMEQPETGLETMLSLVEEGLSLIRSSRRMLEEAELRIRRLEEQPQEPAAAPTHTQSQDDGFSLL